MLTEYNQLVLWSKHQLGEVKTNELKQLPTRIAYRVLLDRYIKTREKIRVSDRRDYVTREQRVSF